MFKPSKSLYPLFLFFILFVLFLTITRFIFINTYQQDISYKILSFEIFPPPHVGGILKSKIYWVIDLSIGLSVLVLLAAVFFLKNRKIKDFVKNNLYKRGVFPLFVIIYGMVTLFQIFVHAQYASLEKMDYQGKTLNQKQDMIFQFAYTFARDVRRKIPGEHIAQIITDLDLERSAEMTLHRQLCYFLYPINVRSHPQDAVPDVLVFLGKKNALQAIPPGYELVHRYDDENMVAKRIGGNGP
ncbi:MAG: hypothetical protein AB7S78_00640 [Candidatus Omnitrophota bacterium]